jgi:hypothetical protein
MGLGRRLGPDGRRVRSRRAHRRRQRLRQQREFHLLPEEARGYGFEADVENADFAVAFTLGTREQIRVNAYPDQVRETWTWGGPVPQAADVRNYTEGTLSIDLFDVRLRRPVWHGWATRTISYADRTNPSPVIAEVVEAILAQFPPQ